MRMKIDPPGTRIRWNPGTQLRLAQETAATLKAWGYDAGFDNRTMMKAFRAIQPIVLTPNLHRDVSGPSQVPWLQPLVAAVLGQEEPPTPPTSTHADTLDLILDTLTTLSDQVSKMEEMRSSIDALTARINHLHDFIIRKRAKVKEKALTRTTTLPMTVVPPPKTKSFRVAVVGLTRKDQKTHIQNAMIGFGYDMEVVFDQDVKSPHRLPQVNEVIMMKWVTKSYMIAAQHLYPGRTHIAPGLNRAIEMLHRFGQKATQRD